MRVRTKDMLLPALMFLVFGASYAFAQQPCNPNQTTTTLCDPTQIGSGSIEGVIGQVFLAVDAVIGVLAMAMIVYSAFRMVFSRGEPQQITLAKTSLTYAIVGLLISVGAYAIVLAVGNAIGIRDGTFGQNASIPTNPLNSDSLGEWVTSLVLFFARIFGTAAVLMVIYQGFMYVTSRGNEQQATKAKTGLYWSVLGFAAASLAFVIVSVINQLVT